HQQMRVEGKEVYCSQSEEQVASKQETDTFMGSTVYEQTHQVNFQEAAEAQKKNQERSKPFSCVICEKSFTAKHALNDHIRIHTGEKPFSCGNCGKSFSQKQDLSRHMMIHTGEKPFSCGNCGQSFSQKPNLTQHMMIHTGEKPFSCGNCGQSFSHKQNLTHSGHILVALIISHCRAIRVLITVSVRFKGDPSLSHMYITHVNSAKHVNVALLQHIIR
uniref:C2H2-type domain-containing protein n=1 Tax=Xiphophorus couchianus TaxID=32473 RepID=A0A3B5MKN5_9TELE